MTGRNRSTKPSLPNMLLSMEVRWFISERAPIILPLSIGSGHKPQRELQRDQYILLPEASTVSAKLRNGQLELKYLVQEYGIITPSSRISGRASFWRKLSISWPQSSPPHNVLTLNKERWIYSFGVDDKGNSYPAVFSDLPRINFNVELCRLKVNNQDWQSICVACYGERGKLPQCFEIACRLLNRENIGVLRLEQSFDFPQWLTLQHRA